MECASPTNAYQYDERMVELLQKKIACQEAELETLRREKEDKAAAAAEAAENCDNRSGPAESPDAQQVVHGIDITGLHERYGAAYAAAHGVPVGAAPLLLHLREEAAAQPTGKVFHPSQNSVTPWPTTEKALRNLFDSLDSERQGFLTKPDFAAWYRSFENYGADEGSHVIHEKLTRYNSLGRDRLSYHEFAILMLEVAKK